MDAPLLLGFDIGGTKSAVVLGDVEGRILERHQIDTADPDTTVASLIDAARPWCRSHRPAAAGVSVGSPLDRKRGLIQSPANLPHWVDVPVVERVREALGIPVNLENDADAAAMAEWHWGCRRAVSDMVYLTCGTGQGAGLILDGRLHRGVSNLAGEIGHVRLRDAGPVGCRKAGSVEGFTSGKALGSLARIALAKPHPPTVLDEHEHVDGRIVGDAALAGDAVAIQIVTELGTHLGHACAILIDILNPRRISLGSLAIRLGELILRPTRAAAQTEAMARSYEACTIDVALLGDRVQDLAALAAAISDKALA
ncbi:MAG: ROK family protein [Planctomycetes bacterium]|nr:ROK family protein [Planctomycetota bacterium]